MADPKTRTGCAADVDPDMTCGRPAVAPHPVHGYRYPLCAHHLRDVSATPEADR